MNGWTDGKRSAQSRPCAMGALIIGSPRGKSPMIRLRSERERPDGGGAVLPGSPSGATTIIAPLRCCAGQTAGTLAKFANKFHCTEAAAGRVRLAARRPDGSARNTSGFAAILRSDFPIPGRFARSDRRRRHGVRQYPPTAGAYFGFAACVADESCDARRTDPRDRPGSRGLQAPQP